jgi:hypothetical protein
LSVAFVVFYKKEQYDSTKRSTPQDIFFEKFINSSERMPSKEHVRNSNATQRIQNHEATPDVWYIKNCTGARSEIWPSFLILSVILRTPRCQKYLMNDTA